MYLIPWKKRENFHDLENIKDEINRLFKSSMRRWEDDDKGLLESDWNPTIEIQESKDNVVVVADLPGVAKEDIDVAVDGDLLTIKGEKKQEKEAKEKDFIRTERFYGSFTRSITLPCAVEATAVDAQYKDGVLKLVLPKIEEAKPKQIQVKVK
ncbi:MAG: Hsp20/alpha crystallin family protein [Endomicrobiales bacterium]|jgi:HSP20 family protein